MKHVSIALLVLLASVSSMAQTKTTFDRFKNTTHFTTGETEASKVTYDGGKDASILIRRMGMIVGFGCEGQVGGCKPAEVELLFVAHTADWTTNGNKVVNLLIDGEPETAGKADWDGHVLGSHDLVEYNDITISPELLTKMAGANTVDVQIGALEFSLTDANLTSIRDIASHAGWRPKALNKPLSENSGASNGSLTAAQLAQDGHASSQLGSPARTGFPPQTRTTLLSATQGVDFSAYIRHLHDDIQRNWVPLIPDNVQSPEFKKGIVGIRFTILPSGEIQIGGIKLESPSGDGALDKAAWYAIISEGQFPPLPRDFHGTALELRVDFFYNTPIEP